MTDRESWVQVQTRRGREVGILPMFGSPEWLELPDDDPRKHAAAAVGAECWWRSCDPARIEQELRDELNVRSLVEEQLEHEEWTHAAGRVVAIATARVRRDARRSS
jgi:hypothetical protein